VAQNSAAFSITGVVIAAYAIMPFNLKTAVDGR
jgi:hypothetical protein